MPRQLIFTSAPRGLTPGQSGYCTVARSRDLREALILRLEKLSYYTPEANTNPVICAHRIIEIRGARFHVLTRITDAGLDFTRRRSFIAHHLVFEQSEISNTASPAEIFSTWKGWKQNWDGDPQWLDDNLAFKSSTGASDTQVADVWFTGDENARASFLPALIKLGVSWGAPFTNCFQPGDDPNNFKIKAAWPGTPGYESAKRLDAAFSDKISVVEKESAPVSSEPEIPAAEPQLAQAAVQPQRRRFSLLWPALAAVLLLMAFAAAMFFRKRAHHPVVVTPAPRPIQSADHLDTIFPNRPTWLALPGKTNIAPLDDLMRQLAANEIFTKDLSATLQTNLHSPAVPVPLFANPHEGVLRFGDVDAFKPALRDPFAIEIPGRFRILFIPRPIELPARLVQITPTNAQPVSDFEGRLLRLELPPHAQLALRPIVSGKDILSPAEHAFSLAPSLSLDLADIHAHVDRILASKESKWRGYQQEREKLAAENQLLTEARTPEQKKAQERLKALDLAIPKAEKEFTSLQQKAAAIPKTFSSGDRFALFLCLSNVNTEIVRFVDAP